MPVSRRQLLLSVSAVWLSGPAAAGSARAAPMQLTLTVAQTVFWTAQEPIVELVLRNTGATPIEVPSLSATINRQPAYTLRGPSYPAGMTRGMRHVAPDMPPVLETVEPGEVLSARVGLQGIFGVLAPGDYTVSVSLNSPSGDAHSDSVSFKVSAAHALQTGLCADDGAQESYPLRVAVLAEDPDGAALGMALFAEAGEHNSRVEFRTNYPITRLPERPRRLLGVAANRIGIFQPQVRVCATTDAGLCVWNPKSLRVDLLPLPPQTVAVRPALAAGDDVLSAFIFDPAMQSCGVVRFPLDHPPSTAWGHAVGRHVVSSRAAIDQRNSIAAVLVAETDDGMEMMLVEEAGVRRASIPGVKPFPDSEPALTHSPEGRIDCAVAVRTGNPDVARIVSVEWRDDATAAGISSQEVVLPEPVRAFALGYTVVRGPRRLVWCAILEGGGLRTAEWSVPAGALDVRIPLPAELLVLSEQNLLTGITVEGRADLIKVG